MDLLKKLDTKERLLVAKGMNLSKEKLFELIQNAVDNGLGRMTRYLCELLHVSRSGYYSYIQAVDSRLGRTQSDASAGMLIKKAFHRRGYKKGSRSIKMILENEFGVVYNLKKIRRLMKKFDIVCPHRKPNPYKRMAKVTQEHRTLPNPYSGILKSVFPDWPCLPTSPTYRMVAQRRLSCLPYWMPPQERSCPILYPVKSRWMLRLIRSICL